MSQPRTQPRRILAPISVGELIDKITILKIKNERILDPAKRAKIAQELALLCQIRNDSGLASAELEALADELHAVNMTLWDIEDSVRELESAGDFGQNFIAVARSVYITNDRRAHIKNRIDIASGSDIVEQKSYRGL
jgi:hypothetical protein